MVCVNWILVNETLTSMNYKTFYQRDVAGMVFCNNELTLPDLLMHMNVPAQRVNIVSGDGLSPALYKSITRFIFLLGQQTQM